MGARVSLWPSVYARRDQPDRVGEKGSNEAGLGRGHEREIAPKMRANIAHQVILALTAAVFLNTSTVAQTDGVVAWWKFNEGTGNVAEDSAGGHRDSILNHHQWAKGVSEAGLKFDGFPTVIERAAEEVPQLGPQFSIEAWIAIQSYPWNWVAIVDQERDRHSGYYFGIDAEGRLGLQLSVWNTWESCVSQTRLPLMRWTHVVGTYDPLSGVRLYIDGKLAGKLPLTGRMEWTRPRKSDYE